MGDTVCIWDNLFPDGGNSLLESTYRQIAVIRYKEILERKEEILSAFIAQYGCYPDEIEVVEERNHSGLKWYVRKRA